MNYQWIRALELLVKLGIQNIVRRLLQHILNDAALKFYDDRYRSQVSLISFSFVFPVYLISVDNKITSSG